LIFSECGVDCDSEDKMIFKNVGIQKDVCPACKGSVFCDPIEKDGVIVAYKIVCGNCGKEFDESEWPPPIREQ